MHKLLPALLVLLACDPEATAPRRHHPVSASPPVVSPEDACLQRHNVHNDACGTCGPFSSCSPVNQCRSAAADVFRACMAKLGHATELKAEHSTHL